MGQSISEPRSMLGPCAKVPKMTQAQVRQFAGRTPRIKRVVILMALILL